MANNFGDSRIIEYWLFENNLTAGKAGNDLTGTCSYQSVGPLEGNYSLDLESGSSQSVYRADASLSANFPLKYGDAVKKISVAVWIQPESLPVGTTMAACFSKWGAIYGSRTFVIWFGSTGYLAVSIGYNSGDSGEDWSPGAVFTAGRKYHIGVALDGVAKTALVRVWDDYNSTATTYTHTYTNEMSVEDARLYIGTYYGGTTYYDGLIDEVVVSNALLSANEFDEIRQGAFLGWISNVPNSASHSQTASKPQMMKEIAYETKTYESDYLTSLVSPYHAVTNLFVFQFEQTYYFTSFAQDITYNSHWWRHKAIRFDESRLSMSGGVDTIDLEFPNQDKWFSIRCLAEGLVGKPIYIYQVALDGNNRVIYAELIFFGYGDKRRYHQEKGIFTVKNHMALWRKQTPPIHTPSCRWQFKELADEVTGTDTNNYRCIVDHPAGSANRPITGAFYASYWQQIGNSGSTWVTGTQYSAGTCKFPGVYLDFTSGSIVSGSYLTPGVTITGSISGATAYLQGVQLNSGTFAAGSAAGVVSFRTQTDTFQAENLNIGADLDVATIAGDSVAPADFTCDQSWEACTKYGNRDNYGGNRWLPWLEDPGNRIWWGRIPRRD